eukprot:SAG31_NODE_790_length_12082_cov_8.754319_13_plen_169_part_00
MDSKRWLLRFCGSQVTTEMEAPRSVWLPPPPAAITIGRASMTSASTTMLPSEAPVHVQVTGPRSLARGKLLSRSHLRLETRHDGRGPVGALYATDLGSTNGVWLLSWCTSRRSHSVSTYYYVCPSGTYYAPITSTFKSCLPIRNILYTNVNGRTTKAAEKRTNWTCRR